MAFRLAGKAMLKGEITGYFLTDENGKRLLVQTDKAIKLAERGKLSNWEAVTDEDGVKHLYSSSYSIEDLPVFVRNCDNPVKPIQRLVKDGVTEGYRCLSTDSVQLNYTVETFWQLAKIGMVRGVRAKVFDNQRILESDNDLLSNLPTVVV